MNTAVKKVEEKKPNPFLDYLAVIILGLGVVLYYVLKINLWLKWGIVALSIFSSIGVFFFVSPTGINLQSYIKDSWRELGKVVWPTRKEAVQFTWIVFLFVLILALFLWIVDSSLSWLFYSVILGKA